MSGPASQIEYYARALRAPRISDSFARFGDQARDAGWSHEQYLAAVLSREVSEREASGAGLRIKAARFPGHKTLEDFNFDHQPGADRNLMGLPRVQLTRPNQGQSHSWNSASRNASAASATRDGS